MRRVTDVMSTVECITMDSLTVMLNRSLGFIMGNGRLYLDFFISFVKGMTQQIDRDIF